MTKTFASLAGLVFMLLMISQFIAYFNFSNLPSVLAIVLAEGLEAAGIGALPLLIGMIIVDHAPRRDHPGRRPEVGDLRADLRARCSSSSGSRHRPAWRPIASATRRSTWSRR